MPLCFKIVMCACIKLKNAKKSKVERVAWTIAEQNAFFSVIDKQSADYVMFRLFFLTSPRLGEFLGVNA